MEEKKVLYLYDNFPSYRRDFLVSLYDKLAEQGKRLVFFYGSKRVNASKQGGEVPFVVKSFPIKLKRIKGLSFKSYQGFKEAFIEERPDVVVLQFHVVVLTYWWAYFYMKRHNIPYIIWDCNYTRETLGGTFVRFRKHLIDFTYSKAAAIITYGTVFRDYLLKHGRKAEEVFVAQNTINIESIIDSRAVSCNDRSFDHPLRILYVGAILERKYVDSSIKAVANLIQDGYDIYFDVVGDGTAFHQMETLIDKLNVQDRIILHGAKHGQELRAFFEKDDVFLLPGTGGLAVNEAMAYALPIISTVGDDTVVDLIDGNGYLLKEFGDVQEIEEAIKAFIECSEEEKKKMSRRSEQLIAERASLKNMVSQHVKAIEYVLNR